MVSKETLHQIALSESEYDLIVERLGREPSEVELGLFGSLWSEHCGYKHSKILLKRLPSKGRAVLTEVGEENAGAIDIGNDLCLIMKMESHNHPSAIEPFQGAATGVGGIVRDIFAMGAYPIALLNSLRFGPPSESNNRHLLNGVVEGIASYGNCLGIPDVGGEVVFSQSYSENPLVNAMCIGIAQKGKLMGATTGGPGNLVMLVGADTGRDGLHGASGLASQTFESDRELRPTVQVGNPFMEKLLIEACFELVQTDWIVGLQDLGAAGLTSACIECAAKSPYGGINIDISKVPRREQGMTPYEVMLSESQERMLVIVKKQYQSQVKELFDRWDLHSDVIGETTDDGMAIINDGALEVANVPVQILTDPPLYETKCREPGWTKTIQQLDISTIPDIAPAECNNVLLRLLASPNIASKESIYRQYDHQVQTNTVVAPGGDAAVVRIKSTCKGIALTTDGNGRYCYLNPRIGAMIAVAEAARNLTCVGAEPLAITDCLNFGDPEKPDRYYQLKECIEGIADACREFGIPVISGNVSLYNETRGGSIYPTPIIGMVGLISDMRQYCTVGFKEEGDLVYILGEPNAELAGTEYLEVVHDKVLGCPKIDIAMEKRLHECCVELIRQGIIRSAHDCSEGGVAVTLAECCMVSGLGFVADTLDVAGRIDAILFGEAQSRIVVSVSEKMARQMEMITQEKDIPMRKLGNVSKDRLIIAELIDLSVEELVASWKSSPWYLS
ncbi:MAG: phosphoribosylformylglycinamidine synthase subunit PurL [Chloroflexota bacterium]|nr:phosphoribosylformylglycinamidine synthase subunit PurL [Chloroflexota bacterium]